MGAFPAPPAVPPPSDGTPKSLWREHFRRVRDGEPPQRRALLRQRAIEELPPLLPAGRRLGLYWPLPGEPDLRPLAAVLPERLALPAIRGQGAARSLRYEPWVPGHALAPDVCGIPARQGALPLEPPALGLLLVPALAFDRRGLRLGYGGGWYDRLRADPRWRAVPALIVAPAACGVERLPADPWDVPFDGWLTEEGVQWLQPV
jgi:5-formyltetrahydrofolate cyclo-ligase